MSKQLLIYEALAPVSNERHRDWSIKASHDFGFARPLHYVPLTTIEFSQAATDFPIVFANAGEGVAPVALLGVQAGANLHVDDQGAWTARYLPAFIRRYPFVFSKATVQGKEIVTLCLDEKFSGCNREGKGERLFDADGERTQYLGKVLEFQQDYLGQSNLTEAFCKKLQELELLEPMSARFTGPGGQQIGLTGFMGIQRNKLRDLEPDTLAELSKTGALELAYIHLQSLVNFKLTIEKAARLQADANAQGAAAPKAIETTELRH